MKIPTILIISILLTTTVTANHDATTDNSCLDAAMLDITKSQQTASFDNRNAYANRAQAYIMLHENGIECTNQNFEEASQDTNLPNDAKQSPGLGFTALIGAVAAAAMYIRRRN